jgi:hypothetical protein
MALFRRVPTFDLLTILFLLVDKYAMNGVSYCWREARGVWAAVLGIKKIKCHKVLYR